MTRINSS